MHEAADLVHGGILVDEMIEDLTDRGHVGVVRGGGSRETEIDIGLSESEKVGGEKSESDEQEFHIYWAY